MLIQPATHVVATEADTCAAGDMASAPRYDANWESIVAEYRWFVFEPPGMPADRDTVYHIKLKPGSVPPFRQ